MAGDRLSETREMVVAQKIEIEHLVEGQARIETEVKEMRIENTEQHKDNGRALGKIYKLLWGAMAGGCGALVGVVVYLLIAGAPWVTKDQYKDDIGEIRTILREMHEDHNRVRP